MQVEQADIGRKVQVEMDRFPELEAEIEQLRAESNELENNMSEMDQHLVEANESGDSRGAHSINLNLFNI